MHSRRPPRREPALPVPMRATKKRCLQLPSIPTPAHPRGTPTPRSASLLAVPNAHRHAPCAQSSPFLAGTPTLRAPLPLSPLSRPRKPPKTAHTHTPTGTGHGMEGAGSYLGSNVTSEKINTDLYISCSERRGLGTPYGADDAPAARLSRMIFPLQCSGPFGERSGSSVGETARQPSSPHRSGEGAKRGSRSPFLLREKNSGSTASRGLRMQLPQQRYI